MLCKVCVITVGLAFLTSATPVTQPGRTVPFSKRTSLTREDGVFNYELAELQKIAVHNKHQQNLRNLLANTGKLPKGWEILDFKTAPTAEKRSTTGSVPLAAEDSYTEWTGVIGIGTPPQQLNMDFDTGSSCLVVASSGCDSACNNLLVYTPSDSSTSALIVPNIAFEFEFGDGSILKGKAYSDTVNVGGVVITGAAVGAANDISGMFTDDLASGLLGLAYPSLCPFDTFFSRAISQNAVAAGLFGLRMATPQSEITIGGIDSSQYIDPIVWYPVDTSTGYWTLTDASVLVNSRPVVSSFSTIIDSGSELILGPPDQVAGLFASVPGALSGGNGYYAYPCATPPEIAFTWNYSETYTIAPDILGLSSAYVEGHPEYCVAVIVGQDIGFGDSTWVLGDRFLQNVYSAFYFDYNSVGFAALTNPPVIQ